MAARVPHHHDPGVAIFEERGFQHEAAYLARLQDRGFEILAIDDDGTPDDTEAAMRSGIPVINWRDRRSSPRRQGNPDNAPA